MNVPRIGAEELSCKSPDRIIRPLVSVYFKDLAKLISAWYGNSLTFHSLN